MNSLFPHWFKKLSFVCQDLVLILFFLVSAQKDISKKKVSTFWEETVQTIVADLRGHPWGPNQSPSAKTIAWATRKTVQIFSKCQIVVESRENYQADLNKFLKNLAYMLRSNINLLPFRLFNRFIMEAVSTTSLSQSLKTVYLLL